MALYPKRENSSYPLLGDPQILRNSLLFLYLCNDALLTTYQTHQIFILNFPAIWKMKSNDASERQVLGILTIVNAYIVQYR
jgi:hypothetical protein